MRQVIRRYYRIIIEFFVIALLALLLSGIIQSSMSAQSEFRGVISKNAIALDVQNYHAGMSSLCSALICDMDCAAIYKVFPYASVTALWSRETASKRPILEGTFFSADHLQSSERYAVAGRTVYEKQAEWIDKTPVIYFDTMPYTIIGVLGYADKQSSYDDTCYINLSSLLAEAQSTADGEYIIDYAEKHDQRYDRLLAALSPYLDEDTAIAQIALNKYIPSVTDVLSDDTVIEFLLVSMLMVLVSSFSVTLE